MKARSVLPLKLMRDLKRRRGQSLAVSMVVCIGTLAFVVASALSASLGSSYDLTYERTSFADLWITGGPPNLAERIVELDGVARVETRTSADIAVQFGDRPIRTRIVGRSPGDELNALIVTIGRLPADHTNEVVLEQHTADHFGLGPGDTVSIATVGPVPVVGVAVSPEWLWVAPNQQEIVVDPDEFGVLFATETLASTVAPNSNQTVVSVSGHQTDVVDEIQQLAVTAQSSEVLTRSTHPSNAALQADLAGFSDLAIMFPALFLGAAALATGVLLTRLVAQQRSDIAALTANGFPAKRIWRHYAAYGIVLALTGALLGVVAGIFAGRVATTAYTNTLGIPFTSHRLQPLTWLIAAAIAMVVGGLAGAVPARAAALVDPAAALRPPDANVSGRRSELERLLPAERTPRWLVLAVRNINRQRRRALTTVAGVILSLVVAMTAFVLNETLNNFLSDSINDVDRRGLIVQTNGQPETADQLAALKGVAVVEPHLETSVALVSSKAVVPQRLQVFVAGTQLHNFESIGSLPAEGLVLSQKAADKLAVSPGDSVQLNSQGAAGETTVAAVITETFAGTSYGSVSEWTSLSGAAVSNTFAIGLDDREQHRSVRDEVTEIDGVELVTDNVAVADRINDLLAASRFVVGVMLFLAIAMATALIYNAITVTITERETEIAALQANGVPRGWIRRLVTAENLLTVMAGIVPGCIIGAITADRFVQQFSTDQFVLQPVLSWTSIAIGVVAVITTAMAAQIPALRHLDRLDLGVAVRERVA